MNRNVESHFSELPKLEIERSQFDRSSSHKTSFNVGQLIPFYVDEVLPGDTFNVTTSAVVRLQTLLTPIMDNIYLDTYFFFVPNRLVWSHWKNFMGESENAWVPQTEYTVPRLLCPEYHGSTGQTIYGFDKGSIADYMGIPVNVNYQDSVAPSALPFRAYALICDQWFRDQNLEDPCYLSTGDADERGQNNSVNRGRSVQWMQQNVQYGDRPYRVAKYHDYFTSALPNPQKGDPVEIFAGLNMPIAGLPSVPVYHGTIHDLPLVPNNFMHLRNTVPGNDYPSPVEAALYNNSQGTEGATYATAILNTPNNTSYSKYAVDNLWADFSGILNVNDLRIAFQTQRFLEKLARGGSRYREILKMHFGVTSSDARMQIPEYLGGHRFPLSIHQVANTSQNGDTDFLGDLGAMSNSADVHEDFIRSFEEHGFVIGVCCVRYDHSYPQGMEKFWTRRTRYDYYWPTFANVGEMPIKKYEIMLDSSQDGSEVFGYQEAWAEYRYKPNRTSSEMRPNVTNSLASWHLADNYQSVPSLSQEWILEDKSNVDRVLAVQSTSGVNQVFCDFYVKNIATRPMPMYSIPGLIDHH